MEKHFPRPDSLPVPRHGPLMATSSVATNGSRYILGATDESGELSARQMRDALSGLYPDVAVGGAWRTPDTPDFWHAKCTKAIRELGAIELASK